MNTVQLLGKITLPPKIRELKNGKKVAELGIGVPENYKNEKGEWAGHMNFVDIVMWDKQARYAEEKLQKGDGVLIQGTLQYDQWESKDGEKRSRLRVKAHRVQAVLLPVREAKSA